MIGLVLELPMKPGGVRGAIIGLRSKPVWVLTDGLRIKMNEFTPIDEFKASYFWIFTIGIFVVMLILCNLIYFCTKADQEKRCENMITREALKSSKKYYEVIRQHANRNQDCIECHGKEK
jgi:hypothetical protein